MSINEAELRKVEAEVLEYCYSFATVWYGVTGFLPADFLRLQPRMKESVNRNLVVHFQDNTRLEWLETYRAFITLLVTVTDSRPSHEIYNKLVMVDSRRKTWEKDKKEGKDDG